MKSLTDIFLSKTNLAWCTVKLLTSVFVVVQWSHWPDFDICGLFSRQIWIDTMKYIDLILICSLFSIQISLAAQWKALTWLQYLFLVFKTDLTWLTSLFEDKYALLHSKLHILWYLLFVSRQICLYAQQIAYTLIFAVCFKTNMPWRTAVCIDLTWWLDLCLVSFSSPCRPVSASERTGGDNVGFRPPNVSSFCILHYVWGIVYCTFVLCLLDRNAKCKVQCTQRC